LRDADVGQSKLRIKLDSLLKIVDAFFEIFLRSLAVMKSALEVELVGVAVVRIFLRQFLFAFTG
jgi:hypothetical protein